MRRAAPLLLVALAACTVSTTGAPCASDLQCPTGQGCGVNGKCSVEALSCACTEPGAVQCGGAGGQVVLRCDAASADAACLSWIPVTDCATSSLLCSDGACTCPAHAGATWYADAVSGSASGATPRPTGVQSPAACRFRSLNDALAAASAAGGTVVQAVGWSAATPGATVVFSEPGALVVGPGVTLGSDAPSGVSSRYAVTTAAALSTAFVTLGPGASLSGLEVRNAAATGPGVETSCRGAGDVAPVSLSDVSVSGAGGGSPAARFAAGIRVTGNCPANLASVSVTGAAIGLLVDAAAAGVESSAALSTFTAATVAGIEVDEGRLALTGGTVTGNAVGAAVGSAGTGAPALSATGTTFSDNAGDAVLVERGTLLADACPFSGNGTHVHAQPVGSSTVNVTVQNSAGAARMTGATNSALRLLAMGSGSTLTLAGNEIVSNQATQDYNVASGLRRGGGMVLTPPLPGASTVRSCTFAGNEYDQVLVASSTGSLDLSGGTTCGASSNSFACYGTGVGIYSNGASVSAAWNHWTQQPGAPSIDVAGTGVTGYDTSACTPAAVTCP